jgi:predicted nucleotide-binding protein (sugar kinase/HSP70/actin superfamily)
MGDKPYLLLELDEHSAAAGMITRMEAFANVVRENMRAPTVRHTHRGMVAHPMEAVS